MATQIVILNGDSILIDNQFSILWSDKGKNWEDAWCPNTIHAVIWNNLQGQNEIQNKDASTGNMTGNTDLNATSDAVGSTTVADLLTWAETRKDSNGRSSIKIILMLLLLMKLTEQIML